MYLFIEYPQANATSRSVEQHLKEIVCDEGSLFWDSQAQRNIMITILTALYKEANGS